jgi:uncharacterized phage-like protein YoqJ
MKKMGIEEICFFTGHRLLPDEARIQKILQREIIRLARQGVTHFMAGGALGFDMLCARTVLEMKSSYGLKLILAIPCHRQDKNWTVEQRFYYKRLLEQCDECHYVSTGEYTQDCMKKRNQYMVDHSKYGIAYYVNPHSGTGQTMRYAQKMKRQVLNIADLM